MCYIISMHARSPALPLAKLMFYKEFFSPILFGGKFQGQKLDFQGQLLAFQGQKWDSRILGILFGGKFQGQFPSNILIENSCILFNQKITKKWRKLMI